MLLVVFLLISFHHHERHRRILASSPAREERRYGVILAEKGFKPLSVTPYTPLEVIANTAAFLTKYGTLGSALIQHLSDHLNAKVLEKAQYLITHGYHGVYPSKLAFVEHFFPVRSPPSLCMGADVLHKLITDHLFIAYFFTLKIGEQLHVFSYLECTKINPLH